MPPSPIQEQTVLMGPETGLCRGGGCVPRLIPKPGPGGLSHWGLGSEVLPSWRYLAFWLTPPLLQGLRRLGWAEGHPLMDPGRGVQLWTRVLGEGNVPEPCWLCCPITGVITGGSTCDLAPVFSRWAARNNPLLRIAIRQGWDTGVQCLENDHNRNKVKQNAVQEG